MLYWVHIAPKAKDAAASSPSEKKKALGGTPDETRALLSALRDGDPVKPAQADERCVLVPLRRARTPAEADTWGCASCKPS